MIARTFRTTLQERKSQNANGFAAIFGVKSPIAEKPPYAPEHQGLSCLTTRLLLCCFRAPKRVSFDYVETS